MYDWLGCVKGPVWRSFKSARFFIRKLKLKNKEDWNKYCNSGKPVDIPCAPDKAYKNWISWYDWIGKKKI